MNLEYIFGKVTNIESLIQVQKKKMEDKELHKRPMDGWIERINDAVLGLGVDDKLDCGIFHATSPIQQAYLKLTNFSNIETCFLVYTRENHTRYPIYASKRICK